MSKTLAKPIFVNKQSERLLQRAADAGRDVKGIDAGSKTPRTLSSGDSGQRFDSDFKYGAFTPRGGAKAHSHSESPAMTPRTPRSEQRASVTREGSSSRQHNRSNSRSVSPESESKPESTTPRGRRSDGGAIQRARGGYLDIENNEDDKICAANPNLISESGSDLKWLARMGKSGADLRQNSTRSSGGSSPVRARSGGSGGFNPFGEMDKMRLEFQRLIKEKEVLSNRFALLLPVPLIIGMTGSPRGLVLMCSSAGRMRQKFS